MLRENPDAVAALETASYRGRWTRPLYESFCFSKIPKTIESIFAGSPQEGSLPVSAYSNAIAGAPQRNVVLLFLDAFGRRMLGSAFELPDVRRFFTRCERDGIISPITSQFPSTTAAHITTLHTGLPVAQTGVYEWYYYEADLDMVIAPLLSAKIGSTESQPLSIAGIHPARYLPQETIFPNFLGKGIHSHLFVPSGYSSSPYNAWIARGAETHGYPNLGAALDKVASILANSKTSNYIFVYCDTFDSLCHEYGPDSNAVVAAAGEFFEAVEAKLFGGAAAAWKNTTVLFSADHGQARVSPGTTHFLDRELPELALHLQRTAHGDLIVPAGGPRDFFLHVKPELIDPVLERLRTHLDGVAEVYKTSQLATDGIFGPMPHSNRFLRNLADLVILPYAGESVFWAGPRGRFVSQYQGHHGGLSAQEMESLFCCLTL